MSDDEIIFEPSQRYSIDPEPPGVFPFRVNKGGRPKGSRNKKHSGQADVDSQDKRRFGRHGKEVPTTPGSGASTGRDEAKGSVGAIPESAIDFLEELGNAFASLREGGRSPAWTDLQLRLARSAGILVPVVMGMQQWVSTMVEIEKFLKSEKGSIKDPGEMVAEWLRGEADLPSAKP